MAKRGDNFTQYQLFRGSYSTQPINPIDADQLSGFNIADRADAFRESWLSFIYTESFARQSDMIPLPSQQIKFVDPFFSRPNNVDLRGQSQAFLTTYKL
jgi:hypothetical protein